MCSDRTSRVKNFVQSLLPTPIASCAQNVRMRKQHPIRPHLLAWRTRLKKTQVWLANEIGTSHSTIQRAETGSLGMDDTTFEAIAKAYGITVAELSAHPDDAEKARALHRLHTIVRSLGAIEIEKLASVAESMNTEKR